MGLTFITVGGRIRSWEGRSVSRRAFSFSFSVEGEILRISNGFLIGSALTLTLSQRERGFSSENEKALRFPLAYWKTGAPRSIIIPPR